ncbi:hypothetical protein AFLA_001705 [Aspergillus flavus NRRL3357]|nr:uncharacterized protein G4B84_005886 [Aspergillus flavus NRRL3357]KAF7624823.1 hypothetical protein AFLA_001705 [Aspergillus flavus NRRL3357]QMW30505.1 hypothetical protein G4B84_005886 [Aspergillus flavus NRRL3357]QMW42563.1 hypothetical protein G4B11_005933 [Aspergillus flavus]
MERLPLTDLVNHMKGHQTTNRWDVVVSYDEDKINELLQADSTKLEEILQIEPFTKEVDFWIIVAEGTFDLQLKNPRLQFLAGTTQVALVSELTGTYEFPTTGKGKEMIAAGTQLRLIVSLFNCAGQRIESNGGTTFVPDSKNGIVEGATKDYTIQLDPGNGRGNGLCLVFRNMEAKVISTDTTMKNLAAPIETGITEHFADAKEIYYYLRGLSKYTPSYVNKLLEPVAFNFSITPPDNDRRIPGVLTTWISVKGGERGGQQPSGQNPLNFRPDGQTRCPIPKASSASVIISSHTMANCFFIPSLLRNFKNVKQKDNTGELAFEGDMQAENIYVEALDTKEKYFFWQWEYSKGEGVDLPVDTPPTEITVSQDVVTASSKPVTVSLTSDSKTSKWSYYRDPGVAGGKPILSGGNVTLNFAWNAVGRDDEYKTIQTAAEPTFWLNWAGASTGYSYFYKDIHSPKPNIDLSMDALDYVLTTNVFFPGKEIFKAHSPVANADKSTGLAVPRDLILIGDVAIE